MIRIIFLAILAFSSGLANSKSTSHILDLPTESQTSQSHCSTDLDSADRSQELLGGDFLAQTSPSTRCTGKEDYSRLAGSIEEVLRVIEVYLGVHSDKNSLS
ncbi:MAG: hypothetical protein AB7T49_21440 [Oligoflexales bacterium]